MRPPLSRPPWNRTRLHRLIRAAPTASGLEIEERRGGVEPPWRGLQPRALPLGHLLRVWAGGFEPPTTRLRTEDSGQTELHPEGPHRRVAAWQRRPSAPARYRTTVRWGEGQVGDDPTAFSLATRCSTSVSYCPKISRAGCFATSDWALVATTPSTAHPSPTRSTPSSPAREVGAGRESNSVARAYETRPVTRPPHASPWNRTTLRRVTAEWTPRIPDWQAGGEGVEPPLHGSEPCVLPLDDPPKREQTPRPKRQGPRMCSQGAA